MILISFCLFFLTLLFNLLKNKIPLLYFWKCCCNIFPKSIKLSWKIVCSNWRIQNVSKLEFPKFMGFNVGFSDWKFYNFFPIYLELSSLEQVVHNSILNAYQQSFREHEMVEQWNWILCRVATLILNKYM